MSLDFRGTLRAMQSPSCPIVPVNHTVNKIGEIMRWVPPSPHRSEIDEIHERRAHAITHFPYIALSDILIAFNGSAQEVAKTCQDILATYSLTFNDAQRSVIRDCKRYFEELAEVQVEVRNKNWYQRLLDAHEDFPRYLPHPHILVWTSYDMKDPQLRPYIQGLSIHSLLPGITCQVPIEALRILLQSHHLL